MDTSNKPEFIVIHHTAVSRIENNYQFGAVNNYHKKIGFSKSDLGYYVGYHYFIEPSGKITQAREDDDRGAHCYQLNMNYNSIGICLVGDFDIEEPTEAQKRALSQFVTKICNKHSINPENVLPHRHFATYKTCPGKKFTDKMIENLIVGEKIPDWGKREWSWGKKTGLITEHSGFEEPLTIGRFIVFLYRFYIYLFKKFKNGKNE